MNLSFNLRISFRIKITEEVIVGIKVLEKTSVVLNNLDEVFNLDKGGINSELQNYFVALI